jgi:membrane-associated protein
VTSLLQRLLDVPTWTLLSLVALVVFAEDALFVGFVLPGETAALIAGVAAKLGNAPLPAVLATVVLAAIIGDTVGYEIGRHFGSRVLSMRFLDRRRGRLQDAQVMLARRGGAAVFLARWVAFFRAVMPALAGAARMPYPTFLAYNAAGGAAWGIVVVLAGYIAGASYARVEKWLGTGAALAVLAVVLVALLVWRIRRHRAENAASAATED